MNTVGSPLVLNGTVGFYYGVPLVLNVRAGYFAPLATTVTINLRAGLRADRVILCDRPQATRAEEDARVGDAQLRAQGQPAALLVGDDDNCVAKIMELLERRLEVQMHPTRRMSRGMPTPRSPGHQRPESPRSVSGVHVVCWRR